jgi:hypothetical protein
MFTPPSCRGPNPESALAIACVNRSPKERRFGLELLAVLAEVSTFKGLVLWGFFNPVFRGMRFWMEE